MMAATEQPIAAYRERHTEASDDDTVMALEAEPAAVQTLAIAGGVDPEAFAQAMMDLKDVMGKNHVEAMAMVDSYGSRLKQGQRAIRDEVSHVGLLSGTQAYRLNWP